MDLRDQFWTGSKADKCLQLSEKQRSRDQLVEAKWGAPESQFCSKKEITEIKRGGTKCFITDPCWRPQKGQICYLMIFDLKKKKQSCDVFFSKQLHHGTDHTQQWHSFCGFIWKVFFLIQKRPILYPLIMHNQNIGATNYNFPGLFFFKIFFFMKGIKRTSFCWKTLQIKAIPSPLNMLSLHYMKQPVYQVQM